MWHLHPLNFNSVIFFGSPVEEEHQVFLSFLDLCAVNRNNSDLNAPQGLSPGVKASITVVCMDTRKLRLVWSK